MTECAAITWQQVDNQFTMRYGDRNAGALR